MQPYENLVKLFASKPELSSSEYSSVGTAYSLNSEYFEGIYWFYETDDFIIDIHNFYIKKNYIESYFPKMSDYMYLVSNYLISGSGEWFEPYQVMEPGTVSAGVVNHIPKKYVLHGNSHFFIVGVKFKEKLIDELLVQKNHLKKSEITKLFRFPKQKVTNAIAKLADEILRCTMEGISAKLFFDAKAKEWLSIILDTYANRKEEIVLSSTDKASIENVAKYIEDHFAHTIPQEFLEKIASMSGTKLKETFRQTYQMSITEFTQRKRMNIAETLLLSTDLDIKDIAKAVGYSSPSRFSALFKRYKRAYPKDIRKTV